MTAKIFTGKKFLLALFFGAMLVALPLSAQEIVTFDDLVKRNALYYKKFSDTPFTGRVESQQTNGNIIKGKREGLWQEYHKNGELREKGHWQAGKRVDGLWNIYHDTGQLAAKGHYQNGTREGVWEYYYYGGELRSKGHLQDGKIENLWEFYYENGQLKFTGHYQTGKKEGLWKFYDEDGNLTKTENYKKGEPQ